jgi:hypothetical protein
MIGYVVGLSWDCPAVTLLTATLSPWLGDNEFVWLDPLGGEDILKTHWKLVAADSMPASTTDRPCWVVCHNKGALMSAQNPANYSSKM